MNKYAKEILAMVIAALAAITQALGTGGGTFSSVDGKHWVLAGIAVLSSGALTAIVENSTHPYIKAVVAALTAGFGAAAIALNDNHISQAEMVTIVMAAVVAYAGVYQITGARAPTTQ
jgi:hypothetical protein